MKNNESNLIEEYRKLISRIHTLILKSLDKQLFYSGLNRKFKLVTGILGTLVFCLVLTEYLTLAKLLAGFLVLNIFIDLTLGHFDKLWRYGTLQNKLIRLLLEIETSSLTPNALARWKTTVFLLETGDDTHV